MTVFAMDYFIKLMYLIIACIILIKLHVCDEFSEKRNATFLMELNKNNIDSNERNSTLVLDVISNKFQNDFLTSVTPVMLTVFVNDSSKQFKNGVEKRNITFT